MREVFDCIKNAPHPEPPLLGGESKDAQRERNTMTLNGRFTLALAAMLALAPCASRAQSAKPLEVIVFPGGSNWLIWAAQEKDLFEKRVV
jgi:hypothetical protein